MIALNAYCPIKHWRFHSNILLILYLKVDLTKGIEKMFFLLHSYLELWNEHKIEMNEMKIGDLVMQWNTYI